MEVLSLKSRLRTGTGKSYTRKVRLQGWVPAVYYSHHQETKIIEIDRREFAAIIRADKASHLINLNIPGETDSTTVIKEIQRHVLKDDVFLHVDFQHVAMDENITVQCPIHIVGVAIGVKEDAGILQHPRRTVSIECLPAKIPEFIEVDVSELRIGSSIHVRDLTIPDIIIKDSPDEVLAVVVHPQTLEESTAAAAVPGAAVAEGADAAAPAGDAGAQPAKKDEKK